jgi:hypothetical protein
MASGTADLQRDFGGAIMQSIFGALLTAGYASAIAPAIAADPDGSQISSDLESQLQKSFASAELTAEQYPQYSQQITDAARTAFLQGDQWAYLAGVVAILIGAALVFLMFPRQAEEERLLAAYQAADAAEPDATRAPSTPQLPRMTPALQGGADPEPVDPSAGHSEPQHWRDGGVPVDGKEEGT